MTVTETVFGPVWTRQTPVQRGGGLPYPAALGLGRSRRHALVPPVVPMYGSRFETQTSDYIRRRNMPSTTMGFNPYIAGR